jgi:mannose-6-phosphate isomerase
LDWKPVHAGDFYFVPAGTIHAIGTGISLFEFQQNADVNYWLYDFGRPRELHLGEAVAASKPVPYPEALAHRGGGAADAVLVDGPPFRLCRAGSPEALLQGLAARQRWVIPLLGEERAGPGECLLLPPARRCCSVPEPRAGR